jgi:hypothetical protein
MPPFASMLEKQGDDAGAEEWHRRAFEAGNRHAARDLAALMAKRGSTTEAAELLRATIEGSPPWLAKQLEGDLASLTDSRNTTGEPEPA